MNRREFLEATASLTALSGAAGAASAPGASSDPDDPFQTCDVCGAEKPADFVERTTVAEAAPLTANVCRVCQFIQDHTPAAGTCAQCGDGLDDGRVGSGFSIELEYPLADGDLLARKTTQLCGECASWIAGDINHRGVRNDHPADEGLGELIEAETERANQLRGDDA